MFLYSYLVGVDIVVVAQRVDSKVEEHFRIPFFEGLVEDRNGG
jgi:hypothetical protein